MPEKTLATLGLVPKQKPQAFVLGIAGGSGSGKTTVANFLIAALGERAALVRQDHYYRDQSCLDPAAAAAHNFDDPAGVDLDLLAENLAALRAGRAVMEPRYDYVTHSRAEHWERLESRPVIVAEGMLLFASSRVAAQLDFRVYLDPPEDLRLARRLRRDARERGMEMSAALDYYLAVVRPMHQLHVAPGRSGADLVITDEDAARGVAEIFRRAPRLWGEADSVAGADGRA